MISAIHHVAISTGDPERMLTFYRDQLGFKVVLDQTWPQGTAVADSITGLDGSSARQIMLAQGNAFLELFHYLAPAGAPGDPGRRVCDHGITHLCLQVDDLDSEYTRLRAAGMTFNSVPQDLGGGLRTTYGQDPDGNVVELHEFPPGHGFAVSSKEEER
jgi:catechol 2,3-dioxygenase-like lactoylglutathione lyase family enzyme